MARNINALISRHTTQWFHRVDRDEMSPALSIQEFCNNLLEYLECKKLSLTISEKQFRHNMCEFLCTYYIAKKRNIGWRGPLGEAPRPRGWNSKHEQEWEEYLAYEIFHIEFWSNFWDRMYESLWESRTPDWRLYIQNVIQHYLVVQPDKIETPLGSHGTDSDGYESIEREEE
jgi:hypothetical protein